MGVLFALDPIVAQALGAGDELAVRRGLQRGLVLALLGAPEGLSHGLLMAGLVVLVATPVTRVVLSVVEYQRQRDWAFVAYTLIVLGALVGSVVAGFGGGR